MRARTDKEKRVIVERLFHAWMLTPELRLGQLISNAMFTRSHVADPFYVEDDMLVKLLEVYAKNVSEDSGRTRLA